MTGTITFETIRIFHDFFVVIEYTFGSKLKTTVQGRRNHGDFASGKDIALTCNYVKMSRSFLVVHLATLTTK